MAMARTCLLLMALVQIGLCVPEPDPDPHNVVIQVKQEVNSGCCNGGCPSDPENESESCNIDCDYWCYPSKAWPRTCSKSTYFRGFCDGKKQSPIDIHSSSATNKSGSLTFSSTYYERIDELTIENNGHTVHASWNSSLPTRTISGGGLTGNYTLAQFHFHWGCENNRGSEHTVNGTRYAMELHFVHYKTSYDNMTNAIKYSDGLAVLGVFFNVGAVNFDLKPITNKLPTVVSYGAVNNIPFGNALLNLIPTTRTFYRYQGSLTTPTCNEVVIWSVFSTHLTLSNGQVEAFRKLNKDKKGNKLYDNYRNTQPLHGRAVEKYM